MIRLNKYLSEAGVCSRREADRLIESGVVTVDGKNAVPGMKVEDGQEVCVGKKRIKSKTKKTVLAVYKPAGIVCTEDKREKKKNLMKQLLRVFSKVYATDYMCCSEHAGRWLFGDKEYDKGNVYLLNNAIDIEKFKYDERLRANKREELGIDDDTLVIGHIGRFVEQKNHRFLIDIFNEIHQKNKNSILLLIGQGPLMKEIKEKVEKLNLSRCVKFLGQRNDANQLYNAMDVFLFPSLYEGLGMVLIEAQANGLPCLASSEVPQAAKITNIIDFIDLKEDKNIWVEKILNTHSSKRSSFFQKTINSKYNIDNETITLEEKYLSKIKEG